MGKYSGFTPCSTVAMFLVAMLVSVLPVTQSLPVKGAYFYYGSDFPASDVQGTYFTHIFYAFVDMDSSSFNVKPASDDGGQIQSFSATVKGSNPLLKTLISIGGGGSDANAFSAMASDSTSRQAFIQSSINLARQNDFDGLDLDWEFPQSETDMANLALLFFEWRKAVIAENPKQPLLLTAAVKFNVTILFGGAGTYPVEAIAKYMDWINIMSYDYHGSWEPTTTGEHTALYDPSTTINTDYGITQWLDAGLPPTRAVMGLAMYGRTWFLEDASNNGVGAPATGAGPNGGVYTYDEIQEFVQTSNATCEDDDVTKSAYCYGATESGFLWAGYDDTLTIDIKVNYVKSKSLRGYFFWSLSSDRKAVLGRQASMSISWRR